MCRRRSEADMIVIVLAVIVIDIRAVDVVILVLEPGRSCWF